MMGFNFFTQMFQIIEILLVILSAFYALLAFVIIRQVQLMHTTFKTAWGPIFIFLASLHFFIAVGIVLASIVLVFF